MKVLKLDDLFLVNEIMIKTCKTCKFYPKNCGYHDKNYRAKNPTASFVKIDCQHNCQDYERRFLK